MLWRSSDLLGAVQFGYRTVTPGRTITIYPIPGKAAVATQWQELTFPSECFQHGESASTIRPIVQTLSKEHRSLETASTALNIDASNSKETFVHSSQKDNNTKECWRHFLSKSGQSFMQSLQCDAQDKKGEGLITLYYPFLIRCSSM